jgi:hypothetical protein
MPTTFPATDFFGNTLFCDDIRREVGNKVSYIGTYRGTIFVHGDFPVTLPKFAFAVRFSQKKELFDPNCKVWIFFPGDADEAPSIVAEFPALPPLNGETEEYITTEAQIVLAGMTVPSAGAIKVRILRQDQLHKVGQLKVERVPTATQ